ncbi:YhcN/YlaJ family sporulation lipoprotein [Paenibacillus protaetiae]|uniref:Sporulation protein n=1 Tax=Paenibacillus protaetiae TaxID=2509456 RepID=A0A4V0YEZ5_9BACL|nr:YhcN/YlaJ family sporulation lipoprotein [Paenibacillus protaetiae]QAY65931.1 hypothetical protein ET464_05560 [Paenibacillus protaetiae]
MKKYCGALVLSAALILTTTGCATHKDYTTKSNHQQVRTIDNNGTMGTRSYNLNGTRARTLNEYNNSYGTGRTYSGSNGYNHTGSNYGANAYNKDVSQKIAKHVSSIRGVNKATVVVYNKDVIVGIDTKHGTNATKLKQDVKRAVEHVQPGYKAHVTTDTGLNTRIRSLDSNFTGTGRDIAPLDGHPVRNFANDVGVLINDIGRTITAPFR